MRAASQKLIATHGPALGLLVLRVVFGGFLAVNHGWPKLTGFAEKSEKFASFLPIPSPLALALAILGELVCAVLVVVGFQTRLSALPTLITMLVAGLGAHRSDPLGDGEHALLYAAAFGAIALLGGGPWSVDGLLGRRKG
jgi:putative oxidoreductase